MNADDLRALQAPLKDRYRKEPGAAVVTLRAEGRIGEGIACRVDTGRALVEAGLHPATGGSGLQAGEHPARGPAAGFPAAHDRDRSDGCGVEVVREPSRSHATMAACLTCTVR